MPRKETAMSTPTLRFGTMLAHIKAMVRGSHTRIRVFNFLLLTMLVLGLIALAMPQSAEANAPASDPGFSMLIASDPQLFWWRGGLFDPQCWNRDNDKQKAIKCEDAKGAQSNYDMVNAMNNFGQLDQWPSGLEGAGTAFSPPAGVILNGDLTSSGRENEWSAYENIYNGLKYQRYEGLGNHDYQNYVHHCGDTWTKNFVDDNRCVKESIWHMASIIHHLPNVVNKDVPGRIEVYNSGGYVARIYVSYTLYGSKIERNSGDIIAGKWGHMLIPAQARDVHVDLKASTVIDWKVITKFDHTMPQELCLGVSGALWSPTYSEESCPREWPDGASGSLAYSFDIQGYHFVQLHNHPGYAVNLEGIDYDYLNGIPQLRSNGFNVTPSLDWLADDLQRATKAGKRIVLNMHEENEDMDHLTRATLENLMRDKPVVAIFAGHLHEKFGEVELL